MITRNEITLLVVSMAACLGGYLLPEAEIFTTKLPSICLVMMMFLSFLSIPLRSVVQTTLQKRRKVMWLCTTKMLGWPLLIGIVSSAIMPQFTIVMVIMAGMCSGSTSPYFGILMKGDAPLLVVLVVLTSLMAPITLPLFVKLYGGNTLQVPVYSLGLSLSLYIFLPLLLAECVSRFWPNITHEIIRHRSSVSFFLFGVTNFAVFANNSVSISANLGDIKRCFVIACLASLCFMLGGFFSAYTFEKKEKIAAMIAFAMTNNILVIVLCGEYFGHLELLVAALYTIPFFLIIIPIHWLALTVRN